MLYCIQTKVANIALMIIKYAQKHNITLRMSSRGNCYDNAVAESFFLVLALSLRKHLKEN